MVENKDTENGATALLRQLRQRAEEVLRTTQLHPQATMAEDAQQLLYELQVHQVELEMQNEDLRRVQQELTASRDRYSDLYEFAPVGLLTMDEQGTILEANVTACQLLGVDRVSLVHKKLSQLLSPEDGNLFHWHLRDVFARDTRYACELHIRQREGRPLAVRLESSTVRMGNEVNVRCRTALLDISARRQAEERLQHQGQIIDQIRDAVIGTDLAASITSWNTSAKCIFGYTAEEIIGKQVSALYPPDDKAFVQHEIIAPLQERGAVEVEARGQRKSGDVFPLFGFFSLVRNQTGTPAGMVGYLVDITERKRAEAWRHSLIETTQDAVISIDRQGRLDLFNPAAERIFGYPRAEVQGQKLQLLMPEPYASEHDGYIARYERTGERRAIGRIRTVAARRKNGEVFPIELSVAEVEVGGDVRYAAFIRDISEKVHLQERLIERERLAAIGTTVAKLVHEIGNPLNGMAVATQLLQRRLDKQREVLDDKVLASVLSLRGEITRLSQLLQEFRSFSRRQEFAFRPTNLSIVVQEVFAAEMAHYTERGVSLEQNLPPDLPLVMADGDKLKQVLLNLCKNAVEAMPQGGKLMVRANDSGGQITVEVVDTGVGIPAGVNIFEPFVTTKSEGTGLGLPIVRQIVAAHGGTLTYTSELGRGTTFLITLPLNPRGGEGSGV